MASVPIIISQQIPPGSEYLANVNGGSGPYAIARTVSDAANLAGVIAPSGSYTSPVAFTLGSTKLSALTWNGTDFHDTTGQQTPEAINISSIDGGGNRVAQSTSPNSTTASGGDTITQVYNSWGQIVTKYALNSGNPNALDITVSITNNLPAGTTIDRYRIYFLTLNLPVTPFNTGTPRYSSSVDSPGTIFQYYTGGVVALGSYDYQKQCSIGFADVNGSPDSHWYCALEVDPSGTIVGTAAQETSRPIASGATEVFNLTLRFGVSQEIRQNLTEDIYLGYRTAYPVQRYPKPLVIIARLAMGGVTRPYPLSNPRCWSNGSPSIDVISPSGLAHFQSVFVPNFVSGAITEMTRIQSTSGCKVKCILWDMEGYQGPTYVGAPQLIEQFSPELSTNTTGNPTYDPTLIDYIVNTIHNAGFEVGFTLRPQTTNVYMGTVNINGAGNTNVDWVSGDLFNLNWNNIQGGVTISVNGNVPFVTSTNSTTNLTIPSQASGGNGLPYMVSSQDNTVASALSVLTGKIGYCKNRWPFVSTWYIDSTLAFGTNAPFTPADTWQTLMQMYPNDEFIPENTLPRDYAYSYPWLDTHNGNFEPASFVSKIQYPNAYGSIYVNDNSTPASTRLQTIQSTYQTAVNCGHRLIVDGWFHGAGNDIVITIYQNAKGGQFVPFGMSPGNSPG